MRFWIIITGLLLLASACQQDIDIFIPDGPGGTDNPSEINASFGGQLTDADGNWLVDAPVRFGDLELRTDEWGIFYFDGVPTPEDRTFLEIEVPGYFASGRLFDPSVGLVRLLDISLVPREELESFPSTSGVSVDLPNGGTLEIPADALQTQTSEPYDGEVRIYWTFLDPTEPRFLQQVPAALRGWSAEDEWASLMPFGVGLLELRGDQDQLLDLRGDKTAKLSMPIPANLSGEAPLETIAWRYSAQYSGWVEAASAMRTGDAYVISLTHLNHWLVGDGFSRITLSGKLHDQDGLPLPNARISAGFPNGIPLEQTQTGADGAFTLSGAAESIIALDGSNACQEIFWTLEVTTQRTNTNIGTIEVNTAQALPTSLSGQVRDCQLNRVSDGLLLAERNGILSLLPLYDGEYATRLSGCGDSQVEIRGVSSGKGDYSVGIAYELDDWLEADVLYVCDPTAAYLGLQLDGETSLLLDLEAAQEGNATNLVSNGGGFTLSVPGQSSGTYSVDGTGTIAFPGFPAAAIATADITCVFNQYEAGGKLEGYFRGTFVDESGSTHEVSGSIRASAP